MIPEIMDIIVKCLSKERDRAREVVEAIVDSEEHYLFTNDSGYKETRTDIVPSDRKDVMRAAGHMHEDG